jgi:hypothetical protein
MESPFNRRSADDSCHVDPWWELVALNGTTFSRGQTGEARMRAESTKFIGQPSADLTGRVAPLASEVRCSSDPFKDGRARELLAFMAQSRLFEQFSLCQKPSSCAQTSTD